MQQPPSPADADPHAPAFVLSDEHIRDIQRVIRSLARVSLRPDERDDFEGAAWVTLLEDDQRRLRSYRGECPFPCFLRVVLRRILLDFRTSRWGKWRPSADARRAGPDAVAIERKVVRDGYPLEPFTGMAAPDERHRLARLVQHASASRPGRREQPLDAVADWAATTGPSPEDALILSAREAARKRVGHALGAAINVLGTHDRRLLALRYGQGHAVSTIAATTGADQRRLYRTFERVLRRLRADIEGRGVCPHDVDACVRSYPTRPAAAIPRTASAQL